MPVFPVAPNAYAVGPVKGAPSYSLAALAKDMKKFVTPAPGIMRYKYHLIIKRPDHY